MANKAALYSPTNYIVRAENSSFEYFGLGVPYCGSDISADPSRGRDRQSRIFFLLNFLQPFRNNQRP